MQHLPSPWKCQIKTAAPASASIATAARLWGSQRPGLFAPLPTGVHVSTCTRLPAVACTVRADAPQHLEIEQQVGIGQGGG